MSFTYTQLKSAIQDYAENDETTFVTNLPVFTDFELAKIHALQLMKSNKLKNKDNIDSNIFTNENRYYLVEDFISDKFLWIERHIL